MCATIRHRGPDDEGIFVDGNIGIGMRRLSVIDLQTGHQPQGNEDGRCHIVLNGEIYNYPELRDHCEARGHRFTTRSDTETVLHLYEDRGADCVLPLNGMFAFAIYDSRDRSLLLARDRLGIKPLYYADTGSCFVYGSEIKALLAHPDVRREIDPVALDHYLTYKYIPAPRTIFRQIRKLPPGHILTWRNGGFQIRPYWKLSFAGEDDRPEAEIAEELLERLKRAVRLQMISDVPLGAFLSGGIDSSLIVALMSEIADRPVKTFSIGFEEGSYNELHHARRVAGQFATDRHERVVRPDAQAIFERVTTQFDEPFGDASAIPTYLVSHLAREHVTVALSGDGADELFAGYERYWAIPLSKAYGFVPGPIRKLVASGLNRFPSGHHKKGFILRARRFAESACADPLLCHQQVVSLFSQDHRKALYQPAWQELLSAGTPDPLADRFAASDATSDLHRLLDVDTGTLLADDYLVKDDRMSMAASLEVRVPFLDHTLVEFAASLSPELKLRRLTTKYILKKAASRTLDSRTLHRPKHGFELPVAHWIAHDLQDYVSDLLLSPRAHSTEFLRRDTVEDLVRSHRSGHHNLSREIWALMSLEMWFRSIFETSP